MPKAYRTTSDYMLKKAKPVEIKKPAPQTRPLYKYEREKNQALIDSLFQKYRKKVELTAPIANTQAPTSVFQKAVPEVTKKRRVKKITNKIYSYQRDANARRTTLYKLWTRGFIAGYRVVGNPDKKMCEVCTAHNGQTFYTIKTEKVPPFHPNCRCAVELIWNKGVDEYEVMSQYFNVETGEIKEGCLNEFVFALLERKYGTSLSWEQLLEQGVYDPEGVLHVYPATSYEARNLQANTLAGWRLAPRTGSAAYPYYDPTTGEIKAGATKEIIINLFSEALRQKGLRGKLTWEEIMESGINMGNGEFSYDENIDLSKCIGLHTVLDSTTTVNADEELGEKLELAKTDGEEIKAQFDSNRDAIGYIPPLMYQRILLNFGWLMREGGPYDLKNYKDEFWGQKEGEPRKHWGYIYGGKVFRYDGVGNILVGYAAYYAGIDLWTTNLGADIFSIVNDNIDNTKDAIFNGKGFALSWGDDSMDKKYIEIGYNIAKQEK